MLSIQWLTNCIDNLFSDYSAILWITKGYLSMGRELYEDIIAQFVGKKVLAIGDVYLDEYMLG